MAMYVPSGAGRYLATEHTEGPWGADLQHMGPVAALLVHEMAKHPGPPLARIAIDILSAVPIAELQVSVTPVKDGKQAQCLAANVTVGGREVARATAWRIRRDYTPSSPAAWAPAPVPEASQADTTSWLARGFGYGRAMDWRFVTGAAEEKGPAAVWARPKVPLIADLEMTPAERVMLLADNGHGISCELDLSTHMFVNVDLVISLFRSPTGEWICLESVTTLGRHGRGLTRSTVFDEAGELGSVTQTLFIGSRSGVPTG